MNSKKILISPSSFGKISNLPFEILSDNDYSFINNPFGRKLTEDEVISLASDCMGIIAGVENISKKVIDSLPNLKCISRVGVGLDSIDLDYAKKKKIKILNTPDGPTRSVAEFTLAITLSLIKMIPIAHSDLINGIWNKRIGNLFNDKTIGIIGLGRIGKSVSKLFNSIGLNVIAYDIDPDTKWAKNNNVKIVNFDFLLKSSDIVSLHVPGNIYSKSLISKNELSKMKKESFLINISRGGVVDEKRLYNHLQKKLITGAAIDVFENEPYKGKLIGLDNVVLTPHIASYAKECKLKMEIDSTMNLINYFKDEKI